MDSGIQPSAYRCLVDISQRMEPHHLKLNPSETEPEELSDHMQSWGSYGHRGHSAAHLVTCLLKNDVMEHTVGSFPRN